MVTDQTLVEVNAILQDAARKIEAVCGDKLVGAPLTQSRSWVSEGSINMLYAGDHEFSVSIRIPQYPTELDLENQTVSYSNRYVP